VTARRTKTIVPYSAEEMFDLVAEIEKYPEFIPYCAALRVVEANAVDGRGSITAEMIVAYRAFREKFKSRVDLDRDRMTIRADYIEGPFRTLHNLWRFTDVEDGSEIDFTIEFEFRSFLMQGLAAAVFEKVFARMTDAFVKRAHEVYGGASRSP
jgi:coenzyme Q-binding protein COQ10